MTFNEAIGATPLIAQLFFTGIGLIVGCLPALFIWQSIEWYRSEIRVAKKIVDIKEEVIQQLQASSQEERARSHRFTVALLDLPTNPTDTRLN
jgi:hypothetical protein